MAKVRYVAKENTKMGTHSFYAVPVPNGVLTTDELLEEALDGKSVEPSIARAVIIEFMKTVQRNVKKGFRCQLGENFLTIYPNLQLSVKDQKDEQTGQVTVATAKMLSAANAKSRLGCTVHPKFSAQFAQEVSWQKVDQSGAAIEDDDITQGNGNVEGNSQPATGGGSGTGGNTNGYDDADE